MAQKIIDKIVQWAKEQEPIKVLILTGSRAGKGPKDELSDYDIAVFTTDIKKYATDDSWIHNFESVWVCEPCQLYVNNKEYPTRLVIYKDGLQVDFSFFGLDVLKSLIQKDELPVEYNLGYKVLLDKQGLTKNLKPPTYQYSYTQKPSKEEFELAIRIFFFEAFKEAKALVRNDLGHAKLRDSITKKYLLRMIEWHAKAKHGWDYYTNCHGKRMQSWVDPEIWQKLHGTFAHFDAKDSWEALIKTIDLFREITTKTAQLLDFDYPDGMDKNITYFLKNLKNRPFI